MTEPYRPGNGDEGEWFLALFCYQCAKYGGDDSDIDPCPINLASMLFDVGHPDFPKEWVQDEGGPRCTAFVAEGSQEPPTRIDDERQDSLF